MINKFVQFQLFDVKFLFFEIMYLAQAEENRCYESVLNFGHKCTR